MSLSFTKLFSSITESTIWVEPNATRILWITMLAMADRKGRIFGSIPGLANRARITLAECEEAINRFMLPDPYSRTKEHDGRRIEEVDGGWKLINYEKYRALQDEETVRENKREWWRKHHGKDGNSNELDETRKTRHRSIQAEAEAEAEKASTNKSLPVLETPAPEHKPLALAEAKLDPETPAAILASVCVANSIRTTPFHPVVVEWARDGITTDQLKAAIAKARLSKGDASFPVAYLDPILRDTAKPIDQAWRTDDAKAEALAKELGIRGAKAGEDRASFHQRLQEALATRARKAVA